MQVITADAGEIKLNDTLLPGIFQSMEINGKLRMDEKDVPGSSGKRKQPLGYDDATVSLSLKLLTDEQTTCYEKAGEITALFHNLDNQAKPYVYRIVNRHLAKWRIREVLFQNLRTSEDNLRNYINATLQFTEYKPALVEAEEKAATPPSNSKIQKQANPMGEFKIIDHTSVNSQKLDSLASPTELPDDIHDILMEKVD